MLLLLNQNRILREVVMEIALKKRPEVPVDTATVRLLDLAVEDLENNTNNNVKKH